LDEYTVPPPVVTFDAGQTLVDLDLDFLSTRLAERGIEAHAAALVHSAPAAWRVYDDVVARGGDDAWHAFMRALLVGGGVSKEVDELVAWLRGEQRVKNLWRKPIADMVTLARDLAAGGVRVAVVSNSEGHLAELLAEVGIAEPFEVVIDSTRVGVSKPDPRIFDLALEGLGAPRGSVCVHIGDSWAADVEGARAAGWRAVWLRSPTSSGVGDRSGSEHVAVACDAQQTRAALRAFGVVVD
jgi:HAD superfamily hydrolase (TIGR01549 family)